jgi:putative cell wall-binding protein
MERQYGDDRYQTASAVSEDAFAPGVPVVYVATGANYPDALAAGAAAGMRGGPVILVERNRLPALATTELERLNPARIVIVGSTGVVSAYVAGLIARYQTGGGVVRLAGPDRYATAAAVSANAFPASVNRVYVASGQAFPDALAAVPHAARAGAPVLLVRPDSIPAAIDTELKRLNPQQIILLGSSGAVSDSVRAALETYDRGGGVVRIGGKDRYATAAMISAYHMPGGAPFAYVATGDNFPDALAAGPAAAVRGASTLLARRGILPQVTADELNRLDLDRIYVIGSPFVINRAVYDAMVRYVE